MTFLIAAAGTGGHVYPGLAVGEALVELGVPREEVLYVGGDRLEAKVFPEAGFPFLSLEVRGLRRSLALSNLTLPMVVLRARARIAEAMESRAVKAALGLGGYVTVPTALAARRRGITFMVAEQNAEAGLANRITSRWAARTFGSFPTTAGLPKAEWTGNPVRRPFWEFHRAALRLEGLRRYGLSRDLAVLGVFGGSLGAGVINDAVVKMVTRWDGPPLQIVHLTGTRNLDALGAHLEPAGVRWVRRGFEERMELFYAVSDLVVARAGGAVAELTATATPAILVPGTFGSAGHQDRNAQELARRGAALVIKESDLDRLGSLVAETLFDRKLLAEMGEGSKSLSRPRAAFEIAEAMRGAV